LQHYRLGRDLELAVVSASGLGNRWLLPAGPLREPVGRLARVAAIIGNGIAVPPAPTCGVPFFCLSGELEQAYLLQDPARNCVLAEFSGQRIHAVAGIGSPQRFFDQLAAQGLAFEAHPFPDHHAYAANELAFAGDIVLTTEKDAVKFARLDLALPVWWFPSRSASHPTLLNLLWRN
jgi:tetraacyldisaccharide 4'-kinase